MEASLPRPIDDFMFDLNGYLVLKNAVGKDLLDRLNKAFNDFPPLERGQWWGNAQRRDYTDETGFELHNCVEAGAPFEELIDYPSWIKYVIRYCGNEGTDVEGVFIDECIASVRTRGGHHPVHAGGYQAVLRGRYEYDHGVFRCGQVNIIAALTDIGPGDGATMIVPGSHKANLPHPNSGDYSQGDRMDDLEGAVPVHLEAGDALLFVDSLMHGGSSRTNPGERRILIYRYVPPWGATRYGYHYSRELLDRLTPERRAILQPIEPLKNV
jgi:ectoine hydroxylase-related dioxygenase (phytanoyl-CoA dioxygenase family)